MSLIKKVNSSFSFESGCKYKSNTDFSFVIFQDVCGVTHSLAKELFTTGKPAFILLVMDHWMHAL